MAHICHTTLTWSHITITNLTWPWPSWLDLWHIPLCELSVNLQPTVDCWPYHDLRSDQNVYLWLCFAPELNSDCSNYWCTTSDLSWHDLNVLKGSWVVDITKADLDIWQEAVMSIDIKPTSEDARSIAILTVSRVPGNYNAGYTDMDTIASVNTLLTNPVFLSILFSQTPTSLECWTKSVFLSPTISVLPLPCCFAIFNAWQSKTWPWQCCYTTHQNVWNT